MHIRKRTIVRITSYALAAFLVMGGFLYKGRNEAAAYTRHIQNSYQHAFAEFVTSVGELETALQKSLYATSPSMMCSVCTEVFGKAMSAQMALGEMPFASGDLEHTAGFISKVGDYVYMLSRNAAAGNTCTDEEYDNLSALSQSASILSDNLIRLYADIESGNISFSQLQASQRSLSGSEDSAVSTDLAGSFKLMETEFPEIPSLIYDGPFSEHISKMEPLHLKDVQEISEEEALQRAEIFLGESGSGLTSIGHRDGNVPVYVFGKTSDGGDITVEVTRQGGEILYLSNTRDVSAAMISSEDAITIAEDFLAEQGYDSMKSSYWTIIENTAIINFAYAQENVICYPDLVKVAVALDNGEIKGFESLGYIMSHTAREIPEAEITLEKARENLSTHLTVKSENLAVIPTSGKYEVLCYEFVCENTDESKYIVYVNAKTGVEEKILILLEDENGTLTI